MELIFVRHGEPVSIASTDGSPANPHLSPRGEWQATRVCDWLACEPIDAVITSNKLRAQQTVDALASQLELAPTVLHDLDEIDLVADNRGQEILEKLRKILDEG